MDPSTFDGLDAWRQAARGKRYPADLERFTRPAAAIYGKPKFELQSGMSIFCIGSCFARNIEEHLIYNDMDVLSRRLVAPKEEAAGRTNAIVNKFTTHSMLNEVEWALSPPDFDPQYFIETKDGWLDPQLAPGTFPVSYERALERRLYLTHDYFSRLRGAQVVVMTLGLNEVWFDRRLKRLLNAAPPLAACKAEPRRFALMLTSVAQNVAALDAAWKALQALNPEVRAVVTVSPVPMNASFSGEDVWQANCRSKSVLRAAADAFCRMHESVDYFPSYEMVTLAPRISAYYEDQVHVTDTTVSEVVAAFLARYLGERPPRGDNFTEGPYLRANPDVEDEIRLGLWSSGYDHWKAAGKAQGRPLYPPPPPPPPPRPALSLAGEIADWLQLLRDCYLPRRP